MTRVPSDRINISAKVVVCVPLPLELEISEVFNPIPGCNTLSRLLFPTPD